MSLHCCIHVLFFSSSWNLISVLFSFQIDWPTKLFLAHGVVRGMEYLHSIQPHPVIHGDLKLQNVLVGDGLVTKVCVIVKSYVKANSVMEYHVSIYP